MDPLVPANVDLRDFHYMPLVVRRLLTSETWIEAADSPKVGHAAMCLWCESWHQVPAASLPDNDKVLARLAMCDPKTWKRIRDQVLSGWVKCDDGLLYHPIVAEMALSSWADKVAQRARTKAATDAREAKRRALMESSDVERNEQRNDARNEARDVQRNVERDVHQEKGREVKRSKEKARADTPRQDSQTLEPGNPPASPGTANGARGGTPYGLAAATLQRAGHRITSANPELIAAIDSGITPELILEFARLHPSKAIGYAIAAARRQHVEQPTAIHAGADPPQRVGKTVQALQTLERLKSHDPSVVPERTLQRLSAAGVPEP